MPEPYQVRPHTPGPGYVCGTCEKMHIVGCRDGVIREGRAALPCVNARRATGTASSEREMRRAIAEVLKAAALHTIASPETTTAVDRAVALHVGAVSARAEGEKAMTRLPADVRERVETALRFAVERKFLATAIDVGDIRALLAAAADSESPQRRPRYIVPGTYGEVRVDGETPCACGHPADDHDDTDAILNRDGILGQCCECACGVYAPKSDAL